VVQPDTDLPAGLQQALRAENVRADEVFRIEHGPAVVRFRGEIDHDIDPVGAQR
jgi:hypothetical protein